MSTIISCVLHCLALSLVGNCLIIKKLGNWDYLQCTLTLIISNLDLVLCHQLLCIFQGRCWDIVLVAETFLKLTAHHQDNTHAPPHHHDDIAAFSVDNGRFCWAASTIYIIIVENVTGTATLHNSCQTPRTLWMFWRKSVFMLPTP